MLGTVYLKNQTISEFSVNLQLKCFEAATSWRDEEQLSFWILLYF